MKFAICIDTLGQDRELTDEEKRTILTCVDKLREIWEERENKILAEDRDQRIKTTDQDKLWIAENLEPLKDEEEKDAEQMIKELEEDQQPTDDEHKNLMMNQ